MKPGETIHEARGLITDVEKYRKGWIGGLPETPCGYGSMVDQTILQRKALSRWVDKYHVSTLVDVGAGDLNWIRHVKWPRPLRYIPLDLVPRHPEVEQFDLIHQVPPSCDMVLCLWLINHLPDDHAKAAWTNLLKTDCKYIVYTYWPAMWEWSDVGYIESIPIRPRIKAEMRLIKR